MEHVSDKFPKHDIKIPLGDFNAKAGREDILFDNWELKFTRN
jgi:hypothetical protein